MSERHLTSFPGFISGLPLADIPVSGLSAKLLQAEGRQVLFMEFAEDASVPEHSHGAQWGMVLDGVMELTMGDTKLVLKKGDTYYVPKGVSHAAKITKGYRDVTVFDQPDRYSVRRGG